MKALPLYETEALRGVTGSAIRPGGLALTQKAADWCAFAPGARILDVGCGLGETVAYLSRVHHLRAVGLDASSLLLGEGRFADPDRPLIRGQAQTLPFADRVFQGLFCECVLSLVADPGAVLAEFHRVLAKDGLLVGDRPLPKGRPGRFGPVVRGELSGGSPDHERTGRPGGSRRFQTTIVGRPFAPAQGIGGPPGLGPGVGRGPRVWELPGKSRDPSGPKDGPGAPRVFSDGGPKGEAT